MRNAIEIVSGGALRAFLVRIAQRPEHYREIVVCTPYLDEATATALRDIAVLAPQARCGFRLVTRSEAARRVQLRLPAPLHGWRNTIRVRNRLHAKVYLAFARVHKRSEAIVTSANLTLDGMNTNEELGVRFTGETALGQNVLASLRASLNKWVH